MHIGRRETTRFRPDQQRRRASLAWLLTQGERKPPSADRGRPSTAGLHQFRPRRRRAAGGRLCRTPVALRQATGAGLTAPFMLERKPAAPNVGGPGAGKLTRISQKRLSRSNARFAGNSGKTREPPECHRWGAGRSERRSGRDRRDLGCVHRRRLEICLRDRGGLGAAGRASVLPVRDGSAQAGWIRAPFSGLIETVCLGSGAQEGVRLELPAVGRC